MNRYLDSRLIQTVDWLVRGVPVGEAQVELRGQLFHAKGIRRAALSVQPTPGARGRGRAAKR